MRRPIGKSWLERAFVLGSLVPFCPLSPFSSPLVAAADGGERPLELVVVTAQRIEQNAQDVPIALSAFTEEMLEERQIINVSDLQMNVPNLSFSNTQFGAANVSIRGVGRLIYTADGEAGVSVHIHSVAMPTNLTSTEFYDMERVEVLRGPQGTLYGRNATGGVINLITRRPEFDGMNGFVDIEAGDYGHQRLKGAFNLPVTDTLALRVAGMTLDRDGYTENRASGQVPGIDDDLDGRDLYSYRISGEWQPTSNTQVWAIYQRFKEDDDRARITSQSCRTNPFPTAGCIIDEEGREPVNLSAQVGGIFAGLTGSIPLGASDASTGLTFDFPRPTNMGLRDAHTDHEPVYHYDEDIYLFGVEHDFGPIQMALIGGYAEWDVLTQTDFNHDVGPQMAGTPQNPSGLWPTSAPVGGAGQLFADGPCNLQDYRGGIFGGCISDVDQTRLFAYDQIAWTEERWTAEARVQSDFDSPWNFLLGANYSDSSNYGDFLVMANSLDAVSLVGVPGLNFPPLYPGFFAISGEPGGAADLESVSVFGEVYWQATDALKFTLGLRYNDDEKHTSFSTTIFNSIDMNAAFGGALGSEPVWVRGPMFFGWALGDQNPESLWLAEEYGATDAILNATSPAEFVEALQLVPPVPPHGEARAFGGGDDNASWDEFTGRAGVEWSLDDDHMLYAFYSRGHKPGGFNPPGLGDGTYPAESVNAYELGSKNLFRDGRVMLNVTAFFYDYGDMQTARNANGLGFQDSLDAEIMGLELESLWSPAALPQLQVDLVYAWLDTEIQGTQWIDEADRAQGNPDFVLLKNIEPGPSVALNYIAPIAEVLPLVDQAIADFAAAPAPGTVYPNGIPAYFNRAYLELAGVAVSDGFETDLDGNALPNAPEHSIRLGLAYTWTPRVGAITARYDYYWQDDLYAREYNRRGDEIDAWDQHNASLTYESPTGRWLARAWIRNITDEDNITGHFLSDDVSGQFRNLFMTEPRIYGASLRYSFGGS